MKMRWLMLMCSSSRWRKSWVRCTSLWPRRKFNMMRPPTRSGIYRRNTKMRRKTFFKSWDNRIWILSFTNRLSISSWKMKIWQSWGKKHSMMMGVMIGRSRCFYWRIERFLCPRCLSRNRPLNSWKNKRKSEWSSMMMRWVAILARNSAGKPTGNKSTRSRCQGRIISREAVSKSMRTTHLGPQLLSQSSPQRSMHRVQLCPKCRLLLMWWAKILESLHSWLPWTTCLPELAKVFSQVRAEHLIWPTTSANPSYNLWTTFLRSVDQTNLIQYFARSMTMG